MENYIKNRHPNKVDKKGAKRGPPGSAADPKMEPIMNSVQEENNAQKQCMQTKQHAKKENSARSKRSAIRMPTRLGPTRPGADLSCLRQFSAPGRGATDAQKLGCNRFARLLVLPLVLCRFRRQRMTIFKRHIDFERDFR